MAGIANASAAGTERTPLSNANATQTGCMGRHRVGFRGSQREAIQGMRNATSSSRVHVCTPHPTGGAAATEREVVEARQRNGHPKRSTVMWMPATFVPSSSGGGVARPVHGGTTPAKPAVLSTP